MMSVVAAPPPNYSAPHDFLMLALVATILCAILNLISLAFGIPAVILSAMVRRFIKHLAYTCPLCLRLSRILRRHMLGTFGRSSYLHDGHGDYSPV